MLKQQYDQLLGNREQVRLRSDVQSRTSPLNVQVVEPPSVPSVPAAPNRPIFLTLVLIVALGAGVAAAFVAGQLQTTFPTQQRLAAVTGLTGARHGERGGDRARARPPPPAPALARRRRRARSAPAGRS